MVIKTIAGTDLLLLPQKVVYLPERRTLLIADMHLGKTGHFRKSGIPVPVSPMLHDLDKLTSLIHAFDPARIIFLGDLFHSARNSEWEIFGTWLKDHLKTDMVLLRGNHDSMKPGETFYSLQVKEEILEEPPFVYSHFPLEHKHLYNLCGHVHPAVRISGRAFRGETLECFFFHSGNRDPSCVWEI